MKETLILLALISSFYLGGCGDNVKTTKTTKSSTDTRMDAVQELHAFLPAEPKTIDPSKVTGAYGNAVIAKITESLVTVHVGPKSHETIVPAGAKSWTISQDKKVYTFKIRDMQWSDKKAVTASDYAYGIKRTLNPKTGSLYAFLLYPIKNAQAFNSRKAKRDAVGVKVLDDKTLQITLAAPTPYFLQMLTNGAYSPQRKDIVKKFATRYGSRGDSLLSCGPFKIQKWIHGNKIIYIKNSGYWDAKNVHLTKMTFTIVNDENARMNLIYNGNVDLGSVSKPEWIKKFQKMNVFVTRTKYMLGVNYINFNLKSKYFKNVKIRKAFSLAQNREEENHVMYNDHFEPAYGFVARGISANGKLYENEPLKGIKDDPKKLLKAGLKELGLSTKLSKVMIIYLASGTSSWYRHSAELLQQSLQKKLGITIKAEFVEWPVYLDRTQKGKYDFSTSAWSADYNDPNTFLNLFTSKNHVVNTGYSSAKYDALIAKANNSLDQAKRVEILKKAENLLLVNDAVISPSLYRKSFTLIRDYVKGFNPSVIQAYDYKGVYLSGK
ncbi:MAG: peptide ABC transporter substrate-binding protein [Psychromonas sp.]|nr:peptide ABC transporter substrate-binding protein [Psychromonas sp.]